MAQPFAAILIANNVGARGATRKRGKSCRGEEILRWPVRSGSYFFPLERLALMLRCSALLCMTATVTPLAKRKCASRTAAVTSPATPVNLNFGHHNLPDAIPRCVSGLETG